MSENTSYFIQSLLFGHCWDYSDLNEEDVTIHDIDKKFVDETEEFIFNFEAHLEAHHAELHERLDDLERSFGGNVYFSLSGHGCGFFDERDAELAKLHEILGDFAGGQYQYEQIELVREGDIVRVIQ